MKKFFALCMILVMMLAMAGCSGTSTKKDDVQEDLIKYAQTDLPAIKSNEKTAIDRYNEVSANISTMQRKDILSAYNDEIIPTYTTFYNALMNVKPATTEVQKLKETYVQGVQLQLQGITDLANAIKKNDSTAAQSANEAISQGKAKIDQHRSDMIKLAQDHNIAIESGSDTASTTAE